eukprot:1179016-Prorocentrum_minimum.AAC.2
MQRPSLTEGGAPSDDVRCAPAPSPPHPSPSPFASAPSLMDDCPRSDELLSSKLRSRAGYPGSLTSR